MECCFIEFVGVGICVYIYLLLEGAVVLCETSVRHMWRYPEEKNSLFAPECVAVAVE